MSLTYLIVVIFIVPLVLALYLWRDDEPKKTVYYICFSVSTLALVIMLLAGDVLDVIMPLGLFLASTSFYAGVYLSAFVRRYRGREDV